MIHGSQNLYLELPLASQAKAYEIIFQIFFSAVILSCFYPSETFIFRENCSIFFQKSAREISFTKLWGLQPPILYSNAYDPKHSSDIVLMYATREKGWWKNKSGHFYSLFGCQRSSDRVQRFLR